jgi:hypothetical protein
MMNNKTTASQPLRASETIEVLNKQILGEIKRDGAGQFESIEPKQVLVEAPVSKRTSRKKK